MPKMAVWWSEGAQNAGVPGDHQASLNWTRLVGRFVTGDTWIFENYPEIKWHSVGVSNMVFLSK